MLVTPGTRTSEFKAAVLAVVAALVSGYQDYISNPDAAKLSLAAAIAYIVSRGLAKYEPRPPVGVVVKPPPPGA